MIINGTKSVRLIWGMAPALVMNTNSAPRQIKETNTADAGLELLQKIAGLY